MRISSGQSATRWRKSRASTTACSSILPIAAAANTAASGRSSGAAIRRRRIQAYRQGRRELWLQATYNPILDMDDKPFKVVKYATDITAQKHQNEMNTAFKGALDNLGSSVMVADADLNVIYLNQSMQSMMANAQSDLRKDLPNFDASRLLGRTSRVHKNPRISVRCWRVLPRPSHRNSSSAGEPCGSRQSDDGCRGKRLGTVVEWADRTVELTVRVRDQGAGATRG